MTNRPSDPRQNDQRQNIHRTGELLCRAREVLAYGAAVADLRPLFFEEDGVYPQFITASEGYLLRDTMGRELIDWLSGYGAALFGYGDAEVDAAVCDQLKLGPTLTFAHALEVEVAELLVEMVPCAESVGFGKNGSDALTAAVRLARTATGREIVLYHGFHGFQDWYAVANPAIRGLPNTWRRSIHPFPYNDLEALARLLRRYRGEVATVIMEATKTHLPEPGYLKGVRELTHKHGALLIFDEVVTGFRLANGGTQEHFGVVPDLACFGKALANGLPLSAVAGPRRLMKAYRDVGVDMTYRSETLSLAAAKVVLERLRRQPVAPHLAQIGELLRQAFDEICRKLGLRAALTGHAARPQITIEDQGGLDAAHLMGLFLDHTLQEGLVTNGTILPSTAHDEAAVERAIPIFERALGALSDAVRAGRVDGLGSPRGAWVQGFLDEVREETEGLHLTGWLLREDGALLTVELVAESGESIIAERVDRPDVVAAFPYTEGALSSGFAVFVPASGFAVGDEYQFTLEARCAGRLFFQCLIFHRRGTAPSAESPFPCREAWLCGCDFDGAVLGRGRFVPFELEQTRSG